MNHIETMQQALDALERVTTGWYNVGDKHLHVSLEHEPFALDAIEALRAAIAQGESEPVWFVCDTPGAEFDITFVTTREEAAMVVECALADDPDLKFDDIVTPLYAAPVADYVPLSTSKD